MIKKALIVGFGSAGRRHAEILESLLGKSNILVLSNQKDISFKQVNFFDEIKAFNPDYIVVSSETSRHFNDLNEIESRWEGKTVLIEKPLFNKRKKLEKLKNKYFVGYNLRFHPLINKLKDEISSKERVFSVDVFCNSYLPNWRNNITYSYSSSASKKKGGGVLLDLSHEIDYLNYIFGDIHNMFSINLSLSDLKIDTDDYLMMVGKIGNEILFSLNLKYFSSNEVRQVWVETNLRSIVLDIHKSKLTYFYPDKKTQIIESSYSISSSYIEQHKAILENDFSKICSLDEGLQAMKVIDSVQSSNKK